MFTRTHPDRKLPDEAKGVKCRVLPAIPVTRLVFPCPSNRRSPLGPFRTTDTHCKEMFVNTYRVKRGLLPGVAMGTCRSAARPLNRFRSPEPAHRVLAAEFLQLLAHALTRSVRRISKGTRGMA